MSVFKTKPYLTKEAGQFKFEFFYSEGNLKGTYLQISTTSGIFAMRIAGNTHAYGYLLAAAKQDRTDQLQGYAVTLFVPVMELTQDQGLCNDIQKAIVKWQKRKEKEAETAAKAVTAEQEQANQAFMGDIASEQGLSKKELKAKREADKEAMREIISGGGDKEESDSTL